MPTAKGLPEPLPRQARPFHPDSGGFGYWGSKGSSYLDHPDFAPDQHTLIRACAVLDRDLDQMFDWIEPCDENKDAFSHRTFGQLGRAAMEVEALLSISLNAAGITATGKYQNMSDYKKLEDELRLSEYSVRVPVWRQGGYEFQPFASWAAPIVDARKPPHWWDSYNGSKHDRSGNFDKANLEAAVHATGAALVCLFAQVAGRALAASSDPFGYISDGDFIKGERLFQIRPPAWPEGQRYGFDPNVDMAKPLF